MQFQALTAQYVVNNNTSCTSHYYLLGEKKYIFGRSCQKAKKILLDNPGLTDFPVRLVHFFHHLPIGQVTFFNFFVCRLIRTTEKSLWASVQWFQSSCLRGKWKIHFHCTLHVHLTSPSVWFIRNATYSLEKNVHTLGCQRSYCSCSLLPTVSKAFWGLMDRGSVIKAKC